MNVQEAKELQRGTVVLINHFGSEFVATVNGWDQRCGKVDYSAIDGGGSVVDPSGIVKVLDSVHWSKSDVWYDEYIKAWGFPYQGRHKRNPSKEKEVQA